MSFAFVVQLTLALIIQLSTLSWPTLLSIRAYAMNSQTSGYVTDFLFVGSPPSLLLWSYDLLPDRTRPYARTAAHLQLFVHAEVVKSSSIFASLLTLSLMSMPN
jgi:hypothetical protein